MKTKTKFTVIREDGVWLILLNDKPFFPRFDIWSVYLQAFFAMLMA